MLNLVKLYETWFQQKSVTQQRIEIENPRQLLINFLSFQTEGLYTIFLFGNPNLYNSKVKPESLDNDTEEFLPS